MRVHEALLPLPWRLRGRDGQFYYLWRERGQPVQLARSHWVVRVFQGFGPFQGIGAIYHGALSDILLPSFPVGPLVRVPGGLDWLEGSVFRFLSCLISFRSPIYD